MRKGDWYKQIFGQISKAIKNEYYFEAAFISYGIFEDRLDSIVSLLGLKPIRGVGHKISVISKIQSAKLESAFFMKDWDGKEYKNKGLLGSVEAWGNLYRNPMQHLLGDPRKYKAKIGDFHTEHTKDLAIQGEKIARELSAAVMRYKKK